MILSYHPIYNGDINRLCAARSVTKEDIDLIQKASAVLLPQGVTQEFYEAAVLNCSHVFPNYEARFAYPGKVGQTRLFEENELPHPPTHLFLSATEFVVPPLSFPMVLKYDWGGEGQTVFFIPDETVLNEEIKQIQSFEKKEGPFPFLLQPYIPHMSRTLRCVQIYDTIHSYWRVSSPEKFGTAISDGAIIDTHSDLPLQKKGKELVYSASVKTNINLAGFDVLFPQDQSDPVLLEINYFFGRTGLGGSENYYLLLTDAISRWLSSLGLHVSKNKG